MLCGLLLFAFLPGGTAFAAEVISFSLDLTVDIGPSTAADEDVVDDSTGAVEDLGPLPAGVAVTAYHVRQGDPHVSLDTAVELVGGVFAEARDVVRYADGVYSVVFDGSELSVPAGAGIDALTSVDGNLLLSFDIDIEAAGLFVADEDLLWFNGFGYFVWFDGSDLGVPSSLDLDAVSTVDGTDDLVLSFDTGGEVDGVRFSDEDGLLWQGGSSFSLYLDGTDDLDPALAAADLDALRLGAKVDQGEIFSDGFESGGTSVWSSTAP